VYHQASVYQARDAHDLVADMTKEYPGDEKNLKLVVDLADNPDHLFECRPTQSRQAFGLHQRHFGRSEEAALLPRASGRQ